MQNEINDCPQNNVILYTFKDDGIDWTSKIINGSQCKVAELPMSEITPEVIINGIIMVYVSLNIEDPNSWSALPVSVLDGDHRIRLSYGIVTRKILLRASKIDLSVIPSKDIAFRVVVIQDSTKKATQLDLLNYNETMNFLNEGIS